MSNLDKVAVVPLETSAVYKPVSTLNVEFFSHDINTAVFNFVVSKNNIPLLLSKTDVNAYICLIAADGSRVVDDVMVADGAKGLLSYTIPNEFLKHTGKARGQLYVAVSGTDDVVVQREFTFNVSRALVDSIDADSTVTYIKSVDELRQALIDKLDVNLSAEAEAIVQRMVAENPEQFRGADGTSPSPAQVAPLLEPYAKKAAVDEFNKLSAEKQLDGEVIAARGTHASLKDKLTSMNRLAPQIDYVEKLTPSLSYDEIQISKSSATAISVSNFNKVSGRHLTNVFSKNANDDYWILSDSYVGGTAYSELAKEYKNYELVSGTIDTQYATHWATKGAKIKVTISGSEIYFRRFADNRGGLWRFIIDGDTANPIDVSVYKATSGTDDVKLKGSLEDKTHLIEAEFMGDDPANVPSTGTGNSRGWLSYHATIDTSKTFRAMFNNLNITKEKTLNSALSNKDFAILCRKAGTTDEFHFVPEHNAKGTAFKIVEPQFLLDGKLLNLTTMQIGVKVIGKQFTLLQSVYGRHPISGENLLRIDSTHDIKLNSTTHLMGKVSALVDVEIKDAYFLMLPVMNEVARRLKTSRYNSYPTIKNDGTQTVLTAEQDDTTSYVYTSDINTNLFSALTIRDAFRSLRTGQPSKFPVGQTMWNEHRANSTMQKLYNSIYRYGTLPAGQELYYDGTYLSGEIPNVHNLI